MTGKPHDTNKPQTQQAGTPYTICTVLLQCSDVPQIGDCEFLQVKSSRNSNLDLSLTHTHTEKLSGIVTMTILEFKSSNTRKTGSHTRLQIDDGGRLAGGGAFLG